MSQTQLRVGVDATAWHGTRGLGRYVRCIVEHLARRSDLALTLFSPVDLGADTPSACTVCWDDQRGPWYTWRLPGLVRRHPVDVMFFPTNHAWWFGPAPSVLTIHDLACLHFPDRIFRSKWEAWYESRRLRWGASRATRVCTDSEATKRDVVGLLGCPGSKVSVVPNAVSDTFGEVNPVVHQHIVCASQ